MNPVLSLRGLSKTFPATKRGALPVYAVRDVSFDVARGEAVAVVGESGSGKSTVARMIARLHEPTSGEIWFEGKQVLAEEPSGPSQSYRARVQMVFQDPFGSLNPVHRLGYHIERPLVNHKGVSDKTELQTKVVSLLSRVGLAPAAEFARKFPHETSGGQRQRVAIARALAADPALILADEPTSMLDVSLRAGILALLRSLKEEQGVSFVFITHDLASARAFADRIVVMYAGQAVEVAGAADLIGEPYHPYTRKLLAAVKDGLAEAPRTAKQRLPVLNGGCSFVPRCNDAMERCTSEMPQLRTLSDGREVRCHLYDQKSAAVAS
jgi:peptide/nickel transport system ATP-binding protein